MELFNLKVLLPKEEMQKNNGELKNKENKSSPDLKHSLVLSIDPAEKIIKFNKECEKILGFHKKEVLNKKFFDTLIPDKYLKKWKNTVKLIRKNKSKDDFKLPLLTKNSEEIMILWSSFPVKDAKGIVKDIGFVGKLVTSKIDEKDHSVKDSKSEMKKSEKNSDENKLLKELVEKNLELENKNKQLEKELETIEYKLVEDNKKEDESNGDTEITSGKFERSFSGLIGGKKKRKKKKKMTNELEEKRIQLEERENQLINEKRGINEKINEFCKWREKNIKWY
jgi:PAS domain S-box-containing protein